MEKRHHQTRNTVSVTLHCRKCGRNTAHGVSDRKITHCLECGKPQPTPNQASGQPVYMEFPCYCLAHPFVHWHADGKRYNLEAIDHRFQKTASAEKKEKKA